MIRTALLPRPASLALGLLALSATGGCAHFRNAHERVLAQEGGRQDAPPPRPRAEPARTPIALAPKPQKPTPVAEPAPVVEPETVNPPAPVAQQAPDTQDDRAQRRQARAEDKARRTQEKAAGGAERRSAETPPAPLVRESIPESPRRAEPVRTAAPMDASVPLSASAIVSFANVASTGETLKLSVTPGGKVVLERGSWSGRNWRYHRSNVRVAPDRAAAFAAQLSAYRPNGDRQMASDAACPAGASSDKGLVLEWFEAGRHDRLTVHFNCPAQSESPRARVLLQAPDLLGLRQGFPWSSQR